MMATLEKKPDGSIGLKIGSGAYVKLDARKTIHNNMETARNYILSPASGNVKGYIIYLAKRGSERELGRILAGGILNGSRSRRVRDRFYESQGTKALDENNVFYS